jgi:hypothetical protein
MFSENMHKAGGDKNKAAASLFILALCDRESLEAHSSQVAMFLKSELIPLVMNPESDLLVRFRAIWIVETYALFLDQDSIGKLMLYYGKMLTTKDNKEHELVKAASAMAIFRYLSESDLDESPLTIEKIKSLIGCDVTLTLRLFLQYMHAYPELLEFPNGVQNIMTLFWNDIQYDYSLVKLVVETFGDNFNIVMAKDQFI